MFHVQQGRGPRDLKPLPSSAIKPQPPIIPVPTTSKLTITTSPLIPQWRLAWLAALSVSSIAPLELDTRSIGPRGFANAGPSCRTGANNFLRPTVARRTLPALGSVSAARNSSNVPTEDPKKKAQSIVDSLPGNSLISKTAILSSAAGLSAYAISSEYYVMNEETVVAFCLLATWTALIKFGGPAYSQWADAQNEKIKGILNQAREDHTEAVKTRIGDVEQMSGVVDVTKALFEVSKVRSQRHRRRRISEQTRWC